MKLTTELNNLKNNDIYSMLLFVLYKLIGDSTYSTLSELVYILDKDSLLKLCEYYGGMTITIPRVSDIEELINILLYYQYLRIDKMSEESALEKLNLSVADSRAVQSKLPEVERILSQYHFESR